MTDSGTTITLLTTEAVLNADEWNHVVMTYNNATVKLYHNGVEVASAVKSGLAKVDGTATALGMQPPGADNNGGKVP